MATTFMTLDARALAAAIETIYTVPAATTARLTEWWVSNNDSVDRPITLHIVNSGGSADSTNKLLTEILGAGEYLVIPLNTYLDTGDFVRAFSNVGSVVASRLSGMQRT